MIDVSPVLETLTIHALHCWAYDRAKLSGAKTVDYSPRGYTPRKQRQFDARLVRVLDFERALQQLNGYDRELLIATYRNGFSREETASIIGRSTRTVHYHLPTARKRLAAILDRLDLL